MAVDMAKANKYVIEMLKYVIEMKQKSTLFNHNFFFWNFQVSHASSFLSLTLTHK